MFRDDDEQRVFQQIISGFDTPAFLRRARRVEDAWNLLLAQCRKERDEWLEVPRLRLATLAALAGEWAALDSLLSGPEDVQLLRERFERWQPQLRVKLASTLSTRKLLLALRQLNGSWARFNVRWERFVLERDLTTINRLRAGYNEYYVLEKECMVRSAKIAREGFRPLPPVTASDLFTIFPLLHLPRIRER